MSKRRGLFLNLRYITEAVMMDLFWGFARLLPMAIAPGFGAVLGRLAGWLDLRRRRVAVENLQRAYGDEMTASEARRTAIDYYAHLGRMFFTMQGIQSRHPRLPFHHWVDYSEEEISQVRELLRVHGSLIIVTCHGGAWELGGAAVSELVAPLHVVFRPMANPWLNRRLERWRKKLGVPLIEYNMRALAQMQRLLRQGECIALLADLNQKKGGVFADFFGQPTSTTRAPGLLAVRRKVPVVCSYVYRREEPWRFQLYFDPPIFAQEEGTVDERILHVTQEINASAERFVRAHPTQWQWNYKRWKTQPQGTL